MSKKNKSIITIFVIILIIIISQLACYIWYAIDYSKDNKKWGQIENRIVTLENRLDLIESRVDKIEKKGL